MTDQSLPHEVKRNAIFEVLANRVVLVASLGYMVDIYDLVLFGIVRVPSLREIGLDGDALLAAGAKLLGLQMLGMLLGGVFWGVLADRFGRMRSLFGSILVYSAANIGNAFVHDVQSYGVFRFIAGFGLAGEIGAAVTLVSEILPIRMRGLGSTLIGFAGFSGAVLSALVGGLIDWRISYFIGGALGIVLLVFRFKVRESPFFLKMATEKRSSLVQFAAILRPKTFVRILGCIAVGLPVWVISGIFLYLAPEFGRALGITSEVSAGPAILAAYCGSILGDVVAGMMSHAFHTRKRVLMGFIVLSTLLVGFYSVILTGASASLFYGYCFMLGLANGYWALYVTMTAEQFGTDIRGLVTTSVPNFVRAGVIPMNAVFLYLITWNSQPRAAVILGLGITLMAFVALWFLKETSGRDLDFAEG